MKNNNKNKLKQFNSGKESIIKYAKKHKKKIGLIIVLAIFSAIFSGSLPYILGRFFDSLINLEMGERMFDLPLWAVLLGFFGTFQIAQNIVDYFKGLYGVRFWYLVFNDYNLTFFNSLIEKNFDFHKTKKAGENFEVIYKARQAMSSILGNHLPNILPMVFSGLMGLFFCFYINIILGFIILVGVSLYIIIIWGRLPEIEKYKKREDKVYRSSFTSIFEVITNIFEVKKNTTERDEGKENKKNFLGKCLKISEKYQNIWSENSFIQNITITITRITIFVVSVFFIIKGTITIGELTAVNGYAAMVFGPFIRISDSWLNIFAGIISISKAEELIQTPPEIYEPKDAIDLKDFQGSVEFKNVSFYYEKKEGNVLKGISFMAKQGETIALVGESGVGKSTAIDLIGAFYFPQKGQVLVDGIDTKKLKLFDLRRNIAFVSQEVTLFNDTIEKNIKYGAQKSTHRQVIQASKKAHCDDFIKEFPKKYKQIVGERGVKLSVGQKQRVSIARAMLRDPKILILDEPTSALDSKSEKIILNSLDELMKGRTTFIVAHRLSTVRKADKILVFEKGKIVEGGKHKDLMRMKNGKYKEMYEMHIGLHE